MAMGPIYVEIRTLSPHSARETRRWRQEGQQCRCLCTEGSSGVPDRIVGYTTGPQLARLEDGQQPKGVATDENKRDLEIEEISAVAWPWL